MYGLLLHHLNTFLKALVFQLKMSPQWHYLDSYYDFNEIQHGSGEGAFLFRKISIKHVRTIQQQERQDIGAICQVSGNAGLFDKWLTQMVDLRWHNIQYQDDLIGCWLIYWFLHWWIDWGSSLWLCILMTGAWLTCLNETKRLGVCF